MADDDTDAFVTGTRTDTDAKASDGDSHPLFTGGGEQRSEPDLPAPLDPLLRSRGAYLPSGLLPDAVEVALLLGMPLLLTGDPGTGKSTLAHALAYERFDGRLLEMQVKSETGRSDLLYRIDEMARFRDSRSPDSQKPLIEYFEIQPLGEAIVRACGPNVPLHDRAGRPLIGDEKFLVEVFGDGSNLPKRGKRPTTAWLLPDVANFTVPQRWVVLVDEIDKAPRDTPNDLLEEFERMGFAIPELQLRVAPPENAPRPIVIVTSNGEKMLPDAFLRRCAYHHINFPTDLELRSIARSRLAQLRMSDERLAEFVALFRRLRENMQKKPGTAELLQWVHLADAQDAISRGTGRQECLASLEKLNTVIVKQKDDIERAQAILKAWAVKDGDEW